MYAKQLRRSKLMVSLDSKQAEKCKQTISDDFKDEIGIHKQERGALGNLTNALN